MNLRAMATMREAFGVPVGLSDHTTGIAVPAAAAALGAELLEKHFTLDRGDGGPDHPFALEPDELRAMVRGVRDVEAALGQRPPRRAVRGRGRARCTASRGGRCRRQSDIPAGTVITARDAHRRSGPATAIKPKDIEPRRRPHRHGSTSSTTTSITWEMV